MGSNGFAALSAELIVLRPHSGHCRMPRRRTKAMSPLGSPVDLSRPLFAYGLLKPGELAFSLLEPFVCSRDQARARGTLWLRDGIPLFDPGSDG